MAHRATILGAATDSHHQNAAQENPSFGHSQRPIGQDNETRTYARRALPSSVATLAAIVTQHFPRDLAWDKTHQKVIQGGQLLQ
jgi:Cft2 family RNA processing exonuclease